MSRNTKVALGCVAATAIAATAFGAGTVLGGEPDGRPPYATVEVAVAPTPIAARASAKKPKRAKKPTIGYFRAQPTTINTAPAGDPGPPPGIGPYIDLAIGPCKRGWRVLDGGAVAGDLGVDMQGTYVDPRERTYHVLLEDENGPGLFQVEANLTCIKGVRG